MPLSRSTAEINLRRTLAAFKEADERLSQRDLSIEERQRATEEYIRLRIAHQQAIADVEATLP
ncbi:MAG: hypothetical protein ACRDPE_19710 [Solirubrobacterales bacterium]